MVPAWVMVHHPLMQAMLMGKTLWIECVSMPDAFAVTVIGVGTVVYDTT